VEAKSYSAALANLIHTNVSDLTEPPASFPRFSALSADDYPEIVSVSHTTRSSRWASMEADAHRFTLNDQGNEDADDSQVRRLAR